MSTIKRMNPYIWLFLFAVLAFFNGGRWSIPIATWLAPIFGLLYILSVPRLGRGTLLLIIALYIPISISWYEIVPFPMPIYPIFMVFNAIVSSLPFVLTRLIINRLNVGILQTLIFPLIATGVEAFVMEGSPLGSIGASAYTQHTFPWLLQLVSITGIWGITLLVTWFASTVVWCVWSDAARPQKISVATIYSVVFILAAGFGFYRLTNQSDDYETTRMAGITAQSINMEELMQTYSDDVEAFRVETQSIHEAYITATLEAIESGTQLILWAELAGIGIEEDVATLQIQLQQLAQENGVYIAVPVYILFPDEPERPEENRLYVIDPNGELVIDHVKFGGNTLEGTLLGDAQLRVVETPFGLLSGVICWDTDYPVAIRQAGQLGVDILLSPSYVWDAYASTHFDMATFRAVENGMTVVRQSDHGFSGVINPYGNALTRVGAGTDIVFMDVPVNAGFDTPFPQTGKLVAQIVLIGSQVLLVVTFMISIIRRFKPSKKEA